MATGKCCTTSRGEYSALRRQIYELEKTDPAPVNIDLHNISVPLKFIYIYLVPYMFLLRHGFT